MRVRLVAPLWNEFAFLPVFTYVHPVFDRATLSFEVIANVRKSRVVLKLMQVRRLLYGTYAEAAPEIVVSIESEMRCADGIAMRGFCMDAVLIGEVCGHLRFGVVTQCTSRTVIDKYRTSVQLFQIVLGVFMPLPLLTIAEALGAIREGAPVELVVVADHVCSLRRQIHSKKNVRDSIS